jgi:hypothetical protein
LKFSKATTNYWYALLLQDAFDNKDVILTKCTGGDTAGKLDGWSTGTDAWPTTDDTDSLTLLDTSSCTDALSRILVTRLLTSTDTAQD